MLMADYVSLGASNNNDKRDHISKGVRRLSSSRDVYYTNASFTHERHIVNPLGFQTHTTDGSNQIKTAFFGDKVNFFYGDPVTRLNDSNCVFSKGTKGTTVNVSSTNDSNVGAREFSITDGPMSTTFTADNTGASNSYSTKMGVSCFEISTPIHTSFHYQEFETPWTRELIGGDRNMEQTNLVVTADGKTWDELRNTDYIGNQRVATFVKGGSGWNNSNATVHAWDQWRGNQRSENQLICGYKDWVAAKNHGVICLVPGEYEIVYQGLMYGAGTSYSVYLQHNGTNLMQLHTPSTSGWHGIEQMRINLHCERGDNIKVLGQYHAD